MMDDRSLPKVKSAHATVYVCATSGSPTGPFAWVARTITPEDFSELVGHGEGHFMRLQIVAAIAALNALPEGSTVHVICSDKYLIEHVIGRLDAFIGGKVKRKKPLANLDLFPALLEARDRHDRVTAEVVPWDRRDAEHNEAMASVERVVDHVKAQADWGMPMPVHRAKKARSIGQEASVVSPSPMVAPETISPRATAPALRLDDNLLDLPWLA